MDVVTPVFSPRANNAYMRERVARAREASAATTQSVYTPYGAAQRLMDCSDSEVLLSGPSRTGKTRASLQKIHYLMEHYPKARALIVRKTRTSLSETALQTFEDDVLGSDHYLCQGPQRAFRQRYLYKNGSVIVVGGMDKATRIMSSEYDIIYVQEAIELTVEDWESLLTRLSHGKIPFQQLIADTNPDRPKHWLKQRCDAGVTKLFFSDHQDNPKLWDRAANDWTLMGRAYINRLDQLTGPRKQRLRYGKWVQAEGVVYDEWDESVHLIDRYDIPPEWPRYRVIDFGFTNPFVCQWWTADPDGRLILYREIYMTQRTVDAHSQQINRLSAGERYQVTVADHDAEDRATLAKNGIDTVAAIKDVHTGIDAVKEQLKKAGDGKPRLYMMRDSLVESDGSLSDVGKPTSTVAEITGYIWTPTSDGRVNKDQPLKVDDHGMDAMRYMVKYLNPNVIVDIGWASHTKPVQPARTPEEAEQRDKQLTAAFYSRMMGDRDDDA